MNVEEDLLPEFILPVPRTLRFATPLNMVVAKVEDGI
jgi:hypothetical protein